MSVFDKVKNIFKKKGAEVIEEVVEDIEPNGLVEAESLDIGEEAGGEGVNLEEAVSPDMGLNLDFAAGMDEDGSGDGAYSDFDIEKALSFASDGDDGDGDGDVLDFSFAMPIDGEGDENEDIFWNNPGREGTEDKKAEGKKAEAGGSSSDLDAQLMNMLKADEKASAAFTMPFASDFDYADDNSLNYPGGKTEKGEMPPEMLAQMLEAGIELFEPSADGVLDDGEKKPNILSKLLKKASALSSVMLYALIGILGVGVVAAGVFLFSVYGKIAAYSDNVQKLQGTVIKQPQNPTNKSNYIFTDESSMLDGKILTLKKMLIDEYETVLYFNRVLDMQKYNIKLSDGSGNSYPPNLFYLLGNPIKSKVQTDVRFAPLPVGTRTIIVDIENLETEESCEFKFIVDGGIESVPAEYVNEPIYADTQGSDIEATINNAVFSTDASVINFSVKSTNKKARIVMDEDEPISITLREGHTTVVPTVTAPSIYYVSNGDITVGNMHFGPLIDVSKPVTMTISNLFTNVEMGTTINAEKMLTKKGAEREERIRVNGVDIVLEGMQKQGNYYVLVAHGEKPETFMENLSFTNMSLNVSNLIATSSTTTPTPESTPTISTEATPAPTPASIHERRRTPSPNPSQSPTPELDKYANRVEIRIETELTVYSRTGEKYVYEGKCISGSIGADILFDISGDKTALMGAPAETIELKIKSVNFKINDITVPIDFNETSKTRAGEIATIENAIVRAFERRLSGRVGKITDVNLKSLFSDGLISDTVLMSNYQPLISNREAKDAPPLTAVQVTNCVVDGDLIHAVVMELWEYESDGTKLSFQAVHHVTAQKSGSGVIIIHDEIVR